MSIDQLLQSGSAQCVPEHVDVLIVGAGISGIGAAYHFARRFPQRSLAILEARATIGGTWAVNRYPGARSDSDMYTFGYSFKPWTKDELATGEDIYGYLDEVVQEGGVGKHIRYQHRVEAASWSSEEKRWTVAVTRADTGEELLLTTDFLWMCQGYYRYDGGYMPQWEGTGSFRGTIVHSMDWPEDLNVVGKRVVVIGSGATAATVVPALASRGAAHVTMLQRSPSYYFITPKANEIAETLRSVDTPDEWTHEIVRRLLLKNSLETSRRIAEDPDKWRTWYIDQVRAALPDDFDVDTHFTPRYPLWSQRLCRIPDGDLFRAIREGNASVVTGEIKNFEETGIELANGDVVEADVVVAATGFNLSVMGDIPFYVDGAKVNWSETVTYHGLMFTGVPNLAYVFGYWRASWTLRVDLIADLVCRLLEHMGGLGYRMVTPTLRDEESTMPLRPWTDPADFNPGYLMRSIEKVPRQGDRMPWRGTDVGYFEEREILPSIDLEDGTLTFE